MKKASQERIFAIDLGDLYLKFLFVENNRAVLWGKEELNVIFWRRPLEHVWELVQDSFLSWKKREEGKVVLGFSPSFLKACRASQALERTAPRTEITKEEEKALVLELEKRLTEGALEALSLRSGIQKEDVMLERLSILEKKIDGYPVPSLEGYKGRVVEFQGMGVFLLRSHKDMLNYMRSQYKLGIPLLSHTAESITLFAKEKGTDGLFVDIGDVKTSLALVTSGKLVFVDEIPAGGDSFTTVLAQSFGMKPNIAREFKEKYVAGTLSEDLRSRMRELFLPEAKNFSTLIEERLKSAGFNISCPVFLFGGGARLLEVKESLEEENRSISLLLPKDVLPLESFPASMNAQYTPLMLELYHAQQKTL
ncbi:MAG: hypothetical protein Q8P03_00785 [bacterium]|nr:hypothetical protein [bacterium]